MTSRRGRGRRDNGLDATLWSPLRDVDPRIGEHLLDVLSAAGIAAYLEPSADVEPYTRTVCLPSPPSDRLFVDRARRAEARSLVDEHVGQDTAARSTASAGSRAAGPRAGPRRRRPSAAASGPTWTRTPSGPASSPPSRPRTAAIVRRRDAAAGRPGRRRPPVRPARAGDPRPARRALRAAAAATAAGARRPPRCTPSCWSAAGLLLIGAPGLLRLSDGRRPDPRRRPRSPAAWRCSCRACGDRSEDDDGDDGAVV